ncbi:MAG: type I glyceraldehyde-3-phosphate dehydrogenase [Deltaproteobacteria bacterium]|nr:MAG: type I glyceraldehyde-3-phosphate dehydrogenase [Deltaproteobacteria bacterium]
MAVKIGINGFGRIGRCFLRCALNDDRIDVVTINDITEAEVLAHLLKYDSVHGILDAEVEAKKDAIVVNGKKIPITAIKEPSEIPWKKAGAELVLECTGIFRDRKGLEKHTGKENGAKKVILSAPAKASDDVDITVVMGINESSYDSAKHNLISNASCTTNCLAPLVKVLNDSFGVERGFMTTIHSYTNDQRILDLPHKDLRRARAAALSMIPTTTGAAKAISLVIPEMAGKMDGIAIRVPTPNVSLVDLVAELKKDVTKEEVNSSFKKAAEGPLKGVFQYCEEDLVSIDFNGNRHSSILDASYTAVLNKRMVKALSWYDNEMGFSERMKELAIYISGK